MQKLIGVDFSDNRDDVDEAEKEVEQETPDLGIIIKGYVLADEQSITECEHSDDDAQTDQGAHPGEADVVADEFQGGGVFLVGVDHWDSIGVPVLGLHYWESYIIFLVEFKW